MYTSCKVCGGEKLKGRGYCLECYRKYASENAKKQYKTNGRYMYNNVCVACHKGFKAGRKSQEFCPECYRKMFNTGFVENAYETAGGGGYCFKHRKIVEHVLARKLNSNEVIHHIDGNPKNNYLTNLIVISREMHARLHSFLRKQRVIMEQSMNENSENCWNTLIAPMTTTWLETANVKVIKIWEIGQSASEPLISNDNEEGSETMRGNSQVEYDIVQTTIDKSSLGN